MSDNKSIHSFSTQHRSSVYQDKLLEEIKEEEFEDYSEDSFSENYQRNNSISATL